MPARPCAYINTVTVRSSRNVAVSDLDAKADDMLLALAKKHQVNRSYVARCILESIAPEDVENAIIARNGKPKPPKRARPKMLRITNGNAPKHNAARPQDQICRDLNGEIPGGPHCRYPHCDCRI